MSAADPTALNTRYLEAKNKLESDRYITFQDEGHLYNAFSPYSNEWVNKYDGKGCIEVISVTAIIGMYFKPTDYDFIARRILRGAPFRTRSETDPTYRYYGCKTLADIKAVWAQGAIKGTAMHNAFEDLGNLVEFDKDHPEFAGAMAYINARMDSVEEFPYFREFLSYFGMDKRNSSKRFWRTEYCMFHPELQIAGMADGILYDSKRDGYIIIDYKRCRGGVPPVPVSTKPVRQLMDTSRGILLPAFENSRNVPRVKYGIQLTFYKHMFERMNPGRKIIGMYLIVVDSEKLPSGEKPKPRDALNIIPIGLTKHDQCVKEAFDARARKILTYFSSTMSSRHADAVREYMIGVERGDVPKEISDETWIALEEAYLQRQDASAAAAALTVPATAPAPQPDSDSDSLTFADHFGGSAAAAAPVPAAPQPAGPSVTPPQPDSDSDSESLGSTPFAEYFGGSAAAAPAPAAGPQPAGPSPQKRDDSDSSNWSDEVFANEFKPKPARRLEGPGEVDNKPRKERKLAGGGSDSSNWSDNVFANEFQTN